MTDDERTNMRVLVEKVMDGFSSIKIDEEIYSSLKNQIDSFPFLADFAGICKLECKKQKEDTLYWISPVSSYIMITKKLVYIDDPRVDVMIEYFDGSTIKECRANREEILSKFGVKSLFKKGISFNESHCESFLSYLLQSDKRAPVEHVHSHLGWMEKEGVKVFRSYETLCKNGDLQFKSHYVGNLDLAPQGSMQKWLDMVKHDVLPSTPLTFCLLLGFGAPVLSCLYRKYDLGSLIFCLSNVSSRGKTTAAMISASVFSNPVLGSGTVRSFNATQNYLMSLLAETSGLTVVLDEGATFSGDFNQFFYLVSAGKDKNRLTKEAEMRTSLDWNSIILTTAEFIPVDDNSPNGIRTRCFCLTDRMTKNAGHADRIKAVIAENYGHAGNEFVTWLLNADVDLETDYIRCKKGLHDELKASGLQESQFTSRVFSRLAIVLQVADYVSQCFSLNIRIKHLIKYILHIERNVNKQTDSTQKALDNILAEVSCSSSRYISAAKMNPDNAVGKVEQNGDFKLISILRPEFNRICKKYGLQPKLILKEFKEKHFLDCESDRLSKRVRLQRGLPEQVCYVLKVKDSNVASSENDDSDIIF